jgi:translocation and assembly module TamB
MRFLASIALTLALLPAPLLAQEDDRSFLTAFLEDNLSDAGRQVVITGFAGALSSRASLTSMTIADDQGIWLTLTDVTLDWQRAALLKGEVRVESLTAAKIEMTRLPVTEGSAMPSPEAAEFALPELPVSVDIGKIEATEIVLGESVLGQPVTGQLSAAMHLAGGEGSADLTITRSDDGPKGLISLKAAYANATTQLTLDLRAEEGEGGIAVDLLGVPDAPSVLFTVAGTGPLSDFKAEVDLVTDGISRLAGEVTLTGSSDGNSGFVADLAGDLAPLFLPDYAEFFGPEVSLHARGNRSPEGMLTLSEMSLQAQALQLDGQLTLSADGLPDRFDLTGALGLADGSPVLLPMAGEISTRVTRADLALSYDRAAGEGWKGEVSLQGLDRADLSAATLRLTGSGRIARLGGDATVGATLGFSALGLKAADPALQQALGEVLDGSLLGHWRASDGTVTISRLRLEAPGFFVQTTGDVGGLDSGFTLTGHTEAVLADLARFSALSGYDLGGSARIAVDGSGSPLSGQFDVAGTVSGQDIVTGVAELDGLLRGGTEILIDVRRGAEGTDLRQLDLTAGTFSAKAKGRIATAGSDLVADVDFSDISVLGAGYRGSLRGVASLKGTLEVGEVSLTGAAEDLAIGQPQADLLLAGETQLTLRADLSPAGAVIETALLSNDQMSLDATGTMNAAASDLVAALKLNDLSVLGPGFGGQVNGRAELKGNLAGGSVVLEGSGVNLRVGQAQVDGLLAGTTSLSITADLTPAEVVLRKAELGNDAMTLSATGTMNAGSSDLVADLAVQDLAVLDLGLGGQLNARALLSGNLEAASLALEGTGTDLQTGQEQLDALLAGNTALSIAADLTPEAAVIRKADLKNDAMRLSATGTLTPTESDLVADLVLTDLAVLGSGLGGQLSGRALLKGNLDGGSVALEGSGVDLKVGQRQVDGLLAGTTRLSIDADLAQGAAVIRKADVSNDVLRLSATGTLNPTTSDLVADLELRDLASLGGGYGGSMSARLLVSGSPADGRLTLDGTAQNLALGQSQADRLLAGQSSIKADIGFSTKGITVNSAELTTPQLTASAKGQAGADGAVLDLSARLGNLGLLLPEFPGPLTVTGTAAQRAGGTTLDLRAQGPGQIDTSITGTVAPDYSSADLALRGTAQAALVNGFIEPRTLTGPTSFDLALRGPLALSSLSGRVSLSGGRLADPAQNFGLDGIEATATLSGGQAVIAVQSQVTTGGSVAVTGSIGLAAPMPADLAIDLRGVTLRDPQLYETRLHGRLTFIGPALGGAEIAGNLDLAETELRIPSTGLGGLGDIPELRHLHEPGEVRATRARAGLLNGHGGSGIRGSGGGVFGLNIRLSAPSRLFIRGRGLDAELGGSLLLTGTTDSVVPGGSFELVRGRLDILGKRLILAEATLQMQGDFVPFVRILASTESDGVTSSVLIEGEAFNPTLSITSVPDLPDEEALAHLLFGQGLDNISALQAAQLASAVATLAGRGGGGIIENLRKSTGLDNLDIKTTDDGTAELTAGRYINSKIYTEVTVDQDGKSRIDLNLDLAPHITLRGRADSDGSAGVGVFLQKDY